jgi:hypothetical protein
VDQIVDEVADGGSDLFLACVNNHKTSYPGQVWEPVWIEYRKYGTVFGKKGEGWLRHAQQAIRLADMGYDYPDRFIKRCKERWITAGNVRQ